MADEVTDPTTEQNGVTDTSVSKGKGKATAVETPAEDAIEVDDDDDDDEGVEAEDADIDEDELADLHEDIGDERPQPGTRRTRTKIDYTSEEALKNAGVKPDEDEDDEEEFKETSIDADD